MSAGLASGFTAALGLELAVDLSLPARLPSEVKIEIRWTGGVIHSFHVPNLSVKPRGQTVDSSVPSTKRHDCKKDMNTSRTDLKYMP